MPKVVIYTLNYCPFCKMAIETLKNHKVDFENIDSTYDEEKISKMLGEKYDIKGVVTYPQIIIDGVRFGGNDKLQECVKSGEFEKLFK